MEKKSNKIQLISIEDAAAILSVSVRTCHRLAEAGILKPIKIRNATRFRLDEIYNFILTAEHTRAIFDDESRVNGNDKE